MAWSTPITTAVGDPMTSAMWNTYIRDNENALYGDTSWTSPTLLNSWTQLSASFPPGYRKVGSTVHLRGAVTGGTVGSGTPIFALPAGFRPSTNAIIAVTSNDLFGEVRVDPSAGNVTCTVGSNVWVSLYNIQFSIV